MAGGGANLPVVIQQAPDASRVQELTQRAGELQQSAATAELQREVRRDQTQVRQAHPSDAYNRIDPRQPRQRSGSRSGSGQGSSGSRERSQPSSSRGGGAGAVVDVVV